MNPAAVELDPEDPSEKSPAGMGENPEGELWPGTGIAIDEAVEADNDERLEPANPEVVGPEPCPPPRKPEGFGDEGAGES